MNFRSLVLLSLVLPLGAQAKEAFRFQSGALSLEIDDQLRTRVVQPSPEAFTESETLLVEADGKPRETGSFPAGEWQPAKEGGQINSGSANGIRKTVRIWRNPSFPGAIFLQVAYRNVGTQPLKVLGWKSLQHHFPVSGAPTWAFFPASSTERPNWLRPLTVGTKSENFLGMNDTDYGGGTPLVALWTSERGLAAGVDAESPRQISLPLAYPEKEEPGFAVSFKQETTLAPGESLKTLPVFLHAFHGDVYHPLHALARYRNHGSPLGPRAPRAQLGPIWCAWGYGRDFTLDQVLKTLPMVKKLGFEWVGLDDGWQEAIGDWQPNHRKFPAGEADFKKLVNEIHRQGLKVQLWWAPLAAHKDSAYVKAHRDQLLLNADGSPRDISWWDAWYLCPADEPVLGELERLTRKFLGEWRVDGLKLDGQHLNASPPCFNPAHHHARPELSAELHSRAQKRIFDTAQAVSREALVEACPCGTSYSIYNLPFQNMTVASDPAGSVQVRQKGMVLHALSGNGTVFFGDHVELTGEKMDFASTVGLGGLVGSNFTLASLNPPPPPPDDPVTVLTPEREAHWTKWLRIAREHPLWKGEYLGGLYDMAFDVPEGHAVRLGRDRYFAFYADKFSGKVELRGLEPGKSYKVSDYENQRILGTVTGPAGKLDAEFREHLLLQAVPVTP